MRISALTKLNEGARLAEQTLARCLLRLLQERVTRVQVLSFRHRLDALQLARLVAEVNPALACDPAKAAIQRSEL